MRAILLMCALVTLAASSAAQQANEYTSASIKVMSFNLRFGTANDGPDHWRERGPRLISALQKRQPELMGVQEALSFQVKQLLKALPQWKAIGVGRENGKQKGEFAAIFYDSQRFAALDSGTFWLSETPQIPGSKSWDSECVRICTWARLRDKKTQRSFYIFNTHLDHKSQPARANGMELILRQIAKRGTNDPVILTGDLNAGEENPINGSIRKAGFRDSFRVVHPKAGNVGTTNGFQSQQKRKIDYIYVDPAWEVERAEIVLDKVDGRWISDHMPVTAEIRLGAK